MDRPATEPPAAEPSATLTDEELQDVAAGAASQIDYGASLHGVWPRRTYQAQESVGFIDGVASDGSLT